MAKPWKPFESVYSTEKISIDLNDLFTIYALVKELNKTTESRLIHFTTDQILQKLFNYYNLYTYSTELIAIEKKELPLPTYLYEQWIDANDTE